MTILPPLCILAFDHRATFRDLVRDFHSGRDADQAIAHCKRIIYEGYLEAVDGGLPVERTALIIDEEGGSRLATDAAERGFALGMPVEKTSQEIFAFEYDDAWREHAAAFPATFHKGLVRWNPHQAATNDQQIARLAELTGWLSEQGRGFLLELLVPPTDEQVARCPGGWAEWDEQVRPGLTVAAMQQLHSGGVTPDIWKIEGVSDRTACKAIGDAASSHPDRPDAFCIVLGRGADEPQIKQWLQATAGVPGYGGFALGRNLFDGPLKSWLRGEIEADSAAVQIGTAYVEFARWYLANCASAGPDRQTPSTLEHK
ncbi:2-deoxy-5-keto-D-gluconate 6-phosphate aldolase domain-containing protein [Kribbella sp. NPDC056345]|uniref:2-deoxy-5-keto-D-gluconate 6-phosphate aldolase domain-containing protein n=1 Tax=Kribbella sp. NPDC056345 TaxID=3345789 RepID=UPI0035D736D0